MQYSPNVRAWGCLTQGQLLPFARTAQLINDLHGIAILLATLQDWGDEACVALQMTADTIAHSLRAAPLVRADESGLRVQGNVHSSMLPSTTAALDLACMPSATRRRSSRKPFCRNSLAY